MDERDRRRLPHVQTGVRRRLRTRVERARVPQGHELVEVGWGALAQLPDSDDPHGRRTDLLLARVAAASERSAAPHAISLEAAALAHGLKLWRPLRVPALTAPRKVSSGASNGYRRVMADLPERDVVEIDGLPCTSLVRTVVDCARFLPGLDGLVIADQAIRRMAGVRDKRRWETYLDAVEHARGRLIEASSSLHPQSPGRRRALAVLRWASPWAESPPETFLRWTVLAWGRRDVEVQKEIRVGSSLYFSDVALPDGLRPDGSQRWVHGEWDGHSKYRAGEGDASAGVLIDELARHREIESLGDSVVRFDRRCLRRPEQVVADLTAHLRQRSSCTRPGGW